MGASEGMLQLFLEEEFDGAVMNGKFRVCRRREGRRTGGGRGGGARPVAPGCFGPERATYLTRYKMTALLN